MEQYDVLITYEIRNREVENLCLIRRELERRGYKVAMRMQYRTFFYPDEPIEAKVVVVPGYYRPRAQYYAASHTVKTTKIVNMIWEQVFAAEKEEDPEVLFSIKPWGRSAAHIAWGKHMQGRLVNEWHVDPEHVFLTGHVGLDFLREPLRNYYEDRETVFAKFGIPSDKRTHLFISSLVYADATRRVLRNSNASGDLEKPSRMVELSTKTRKILIEWFEKALEENPDDVIIYRPHPEEKGDALLKGLAERQPRFRIIPELSVKQWVLVCDKLYNWLSTSIAEVYAAGKGCALLRPVEIPRDMDIKMFHDADHITTYEQFREEFASPVQKLAVDEEKLLNYYQVYEDHFTYELICDAIEKVMKDDAYLLDKPMSNPLSGTFSKERIKCFVKRCVAGSALMRKISSGGAFKGSKFRELLDDVFYVKAKLEKNYVPEEEIRQIMQRIDKAFLTGGARDADED